MDCKFDLLVNELRRYGVSVVAIQETKWFWKEVWQVDGHIFLHSDRPLPKDGEPAVKKEGVGFLLDERATAAWKEAGEVWNANSFRIGVEQRKPGGAREKKNTYLSVVCVYAPTAKAPPGIAQKFIEEAPHGKSEGESWPSLSAEKRVTLLPFAVHTLHCKEQREAYQQALEEQPRNHPIKPDKSTEPNWKT